MMTRLWEARAAMGKVELLIKFTDCETGLMNVRFAGNLGEKIEMIWCISENFGF